MSLQAAFLGLFFWDLSQGPTQNLQMFSKTTGLYVAGESQFFNISSVKHFSNWKSLETHFQINQWRLPQSSYTTPKNSQTPLIQNNSSAFHSGFFAELKTPEGGKMYLHAPDQESLSQLIQMAEQSFVEPGRFGFMIPIENQDL